MALYSIACWLRTDKEKKNGKCPIYFRVTVNKEETKIPTGFEIEKTKWDKKKTRPKDNALDILITRQYEQLQLHLNHLAIEKGTENITIDDVKEFSAGNREVKPENHSFYEYFDEFIERKKKSKGGIAENTLKVYNTTRRVLKEFKSEFRIKDLTLHLVEDFDNYLVNVRKNDDGGREPRHKNLKTIVLDMQKRGLSIKNPYDAFAMPKAKKNEVYLTGEELKKLLGLRGRYFQKEKTKSDVLSMYLFACYSGLRISDILSLKWSDIDFERNAVKKTMIKTREEVITILPEVSKVIAYLLSKGKTLIGSTELVFHRYTEPAINRVLKEIAKDAGIEKRITFHTSRHTFATNLVSRGMSIYEIMRFLGHKSIKTTERYLKYDLNLATDMIKKGNEIINQA